MSENLKAVTAFLVVIDEENNSHVVYDIPTELVEITRPASLRDVRRAVLEIGADIAAQAAAQYSQSYLAPKEEPAPSARVAKAVAKRPKKES